MGGRLAASLGGIEVVEKTLKRTLMPDEGNIQKRWGVV